MPFARRCFTQSIVIFSAAGYVVNEKGKTVQENSDHKGTPQKARVCGSRDKFHLQMWDAVITSSTQKLVCQGHSVTAADDGQWSILTIYTPRLGKQKAAMDLFALLGKRSTADLLSIPLSDLKITDDAALDPGTVTKISNVGDWKAHAMKHHAQFITDTESELDTAQTPQRPRRRRQVPERLTPAAPKKPRKTVGKPVVVARVEDEEDSERTDSDSCNLAAPAQRHKPTRRKGEFKGDKGDKGTKGEKGDAGPAGPPGQALSSNSMGPATSAEWMKHTETLMDKVLSKMTGLVEASVGKGKYSIEEMSAIANIFNKS